MPEAITQDYFFGGWKTVLIYSEQEMAGALSISVKDLRKAIKRGELCYHAHPSSNAVREYQFNQSAFDNNVRWWNCMKHGGHHFQHNRFYDREQGKAVLKCSCGKEKYD